MRRGPEPDGTAHAIFYVAAADRLRFAEPAGNLIGLMKPM